MLPIQEIEITTGKKRRFSVHLENGLRTTLHASWPPLISGRNCQQMQHSVLSHKDIQHLLRMRRLFREFVLR